MAFSSFSRWHMIYFGFVLRYLRLQRTLQMMYWQEEIFISWRVFLSQTCNKQQLYMSSANIGVRIHLFLQYHDGYKHAKLV
jgi:hypothetical protein